MEKCNCKYSPVIILPGINHSPTYLYDNNNNISLDSSGNEIGGTLLFINKDGAKKTLRHLGATALASVVTQCDAGFTKAMYNTVCTALDYQKCNKKGDFVNNLKVDRWNYSINEMDKDRLDWVYRMVPMKSLADEIGKDHIYFFTFNLVGDPMDSAKELNDYIQMVKKETGHDKVTLLPVSLGGTILTAYLDSFGKENNFSDIDMIVNAVACLDGTDIAGDIYERKFNISNKYLHHDFLPEIFKEETGNATKGYLINCLLHLLPQKSFNAIFSSAISGLLDTIMINCPQLWATMPSYRYDRIAEKYLSTPEMQDLKKRTDRFQQARLNLKENLINAHNSGIIINSISGSNLGYGDVAYCIFGGIESKNTYNTDGIINLSSTTLGATGVPDYKTFPEGYKQKEHTEHNYISPDNRIDVSTALFPEHTWIFLNQHHEVGHNDAVLNLFAALITGKVNSVHDNPEKYPQFNGNCDTMALRRWRIPDGERAIDKIKSGIIPVSEDILKEIEASVYAAKKVIASTIADNEFAVSVQNKLEDLLEQVGEFKKPKPLSEKEKAKENRMEKASEFLLKHLGGGSLTDKILRRSI